VFVFLREELLVLVEIYDVFMDVVEMNVAQIVVANKSLFMVLYYQPNK